MPARSASLIPPLLALMLASVPTAALAAGKRYTISAAVRDAAGKWQPIHVLEEARQGVAFEIRFLTTQAARAAVRSALGRELDLLPGRLDERRPGYLVFVLQVTNGSGQDVVFNPTQVRLSSDKGDMKFALDYSALYEVARRMGPEAPTFDEMASIIFDRTVTIRPGGSVRKLLAFDAPREDRFRTLEVRLAEVNIGSSGLDVAFPFRKFFED